jgi:putative ABC transport system permease protein
VRMPRSVILRLLRSRWITSAAIALLVGSVTAISGASAHAGRLLEHTTTTWRERLAGSDLRVQTPLTDADVETAARAVEGVRDAERRLVLPATFLPSSGGSVTTLLTVLGPRPPRVDRLRVLEGRWPGADEKAALIDRSTARIWGLGPGDPVHLKVVDSDVTVPVAGVTLAPDLLVTPFNPEALVPLPGTLAVVTITSAALPRGEGLSDSIRVRLEPGADEDAVEAALRRLPVTVEDVTRTASLPTERLTRLLTEVFHAYVPIVVLVMGMLGFLLLLLVVRHDVAVDRPEIGVRLAHGHSRSRVFATHLPRLVLPPLVGATVGAAAIPWVSRRLLDAYVLHVGYVPPIPMGDEAASASALGVACAAILVAAVPTLVATIQLRPARLLRRTGAVRLRRGPLGVRLRRLRSRLPGPTALRLGLASAWRRRLVSTAAVVGVAGSLAVVTAFVLVHRSMELNFREGIEAATLDATVTFSSLVPLEEIDRRVEAAGGRAEPFLATTALVVAGGRSRLAPLVGASPGAWRRSLLAAAVPSPADLGADEVVLGRALATRLGVDLGAHVLLYPGAGAPEGVSAAVVGFFDGLATEGVGATLDLVDRLLGVEGATGAQVRSPLAPAALANALEALPGVERVSTRAATLDAGMRLFQGGRVILLVSVFCSLLMAVLYLASLAALDARDREASLLVLHACGWPRRSLVLLSLAEAFARAVPALALGLLLAPPLAHHLLGRLAAVYERAVAFRAPAWVFGATVLLGLLLLPLAALPALRAARRIDPARVLKTFSGP